MLKKFEELICGILELIKSNIETNMLMQNQRWKEGYEEGSKDGNKNIIDGYYHDKQFVESEPLPIINIGDMIGFKYGKKGAKYKVVVIKHYFHLNENDGKIYHWLSVKVEGSKKYVQGDWVIK